ncbi:uncharacterized protein [Hemitrygon akajei]|uniref:uncharacterized protein n=1 Tax=Hemitrygon akajei TaxID=2704970 RepID=UPI003BFA0512
MVLPDTGATKLCSPLAKKKICSKTPVPGALQQHLFYGEYSPFKYAPIFESDFIQVTKRGEVLSIHKDITVVTVGVTSTSPSFFLPNVMLLARPVDSLREMVCNCRISTDKCPMELTRLFPLCFVNISIHDVYNRQLRLKLANGRAFYLQLYVHPECENVVFERWMKLVALLHNSPENVYGYEAVTPEIECILEQTSVETLATELSDWQLEEPAMSPAMREYYEANRASSRKSEEPEDCSTRTRSRSRKSDSGKAGENMGEAENFPDFSQEQEPWPPVKPPEKKKKTQGPKGFNFFKKDKGSKEKSPEEDQGPGPVTTPAEDYEEGQKMEGEESEEKDDRKKSDKDKGRQKEKSKDKEMKQRDKDKKEKMEKQMERKQQLKEKEEKRQQGKDKKKGREDKGDTDKGSKQQAREEKQRAKEERQRAKEAKQREEEEKKQRAREEKKQREMEEKKKRSQQKDKTKQVKIKGDEEKDMN